VVELEAGDAKLLAELEQARLALIEADAAQNSLSVSHMKLEKECKGLHVLLDTLRHEKA
jgi:hypothetical protein